MKKEIRIVDHSQRIISWEMTVSEVKPTREEKLKRKKKKSKIELQR